MSNDNKKLVSDFKQNSPVMKKMQSISHDEPQSEQQELRIIDNIEKSHEEEIKINYSDCYTYHQNNITQALSLLNSISVRGSDNCKALTTVFDILDMTVITKDKIDLDK